MGCKMFEHFFTELPQAQSYFDQTDLNLFAPKKMQTVYNFLVDISENPKYAQAHITQEVVRHQIYSLNQTTYYFTLVDSLHQAVKTTVGTSWTAAYERAWNALTMHFKYIVEQAATDFLN